MPIDSSARPVYSFFLSDYMPWSYHTQEARMTETAQFVYLDQDVIKYVGDMLTALNKIGFVPDKEYPGIPALVAMEVIIGNSVGEPVGKIKFDFEEQSYVFIPYMKYDEEEE